MKKKKVMRKKLHKEMEGCWLKCFKDDAETFEANRDLSYNCKQD